ncbi:MAG: hypothetical protein V7642_1768 [Burkholderiales bacterium]|jgi:hypothetical protein
MEDTITQLAHACMQQQEVGMLTRSDGMVLLVYPLEEGAAIGIGTGPGFERKLRSVLRKRTENLPRYGKWMPALFNDGNCFVITRVAEVRTGSTVLESDILAAAVELIS